MTFQKTAKGLPSTVDDDKLFLFITFEEGIPINYIVGTWGALRKAQGEKKMMSYSYYAELAKDPLG